jgi:hypothetical protein
MKVGKWDLSNENSNGCVVGFWLSNYRFVMMKYSEPGAMLTWFVGWLARVLSGAFLIIHFAIALSQAEPE